MGDLGDRMKENYENRAKTYLTRRTPVIIRLDGKAFHTLTRKFEKPFDRSLSSWMEITALTLCSEIQGCKCAYVQSDEISLLLTDFDKLTSEAWFGYSVQKMVSISAAMASVTFSRFLAHDVALFDSRAFNIPKEEVANYFVWRQKDWLRNSIQMLAQAHFSHKELHKKNTSQMNEMLMSKGVEWGGLDDRWKNGLHIEKSRESETCGLFSVSTDTIYSKQREVVEKYLYPEE